MIKGIAGNQGVVVGAGNTALPYIPANSSNPMQGMVRVNNTDLEVFNGTSWMSLPSSYATISLDYEIQELLNWARKKRDEDIELEKLAEDNITIKDLVNQIKEKQDQVKMVSILIKKEVTV